jgi:hypothetical protein
VMTTVLGGGGLVGIGAIVAGLVLVVTLVESEARTSLPNNPMNRTNRGAMMYWRNGFLFHSVDKASAWNEEGSPMFLCQYVTTYSLP